LWSVKGWRASPTLVLPKVMPANLRGTLDMEAEPAANRPYWLAMAEGAVRMLFPGFASGIGRNTAVIIAGACALLLLGTTFIAFWL
jgi:hypothetical protein